MGQQLNITVIQPDVIWENKPANLRHFEELISGAPGKKEVVLLPEMFSTGFSMRPEVLAEKMNGATVQWMKEQAEKHRIILAGSLIIEEDGKYFNRFIWMQPDGSCFHYDKHHLFGYADENKHYTAGNKKVIVQVKGWKICLMVCYDLRFPVWARQSKESYDILIYTANWPEKRSHAWKTLLTARAIENQCYVAGVNRVGDDPMGIHYNGESSIIDATGQVLWQVAEKETCHTITLDKDLLTEYRQQFPIIEDADAFLLL